MLFSATFPQHVIEYAHRFAPNANVLTLKQEDLTIEGIKQLYIDCENIQDKYDTLLKFYGLMTQASSIIFVRVCDGVCEQAQYSTNDEQTRKTAEELKERMEAAGHKVAHLTGALEGAARDDVIDSFRNGTAKVLITTNVLARGIDVQSVTMVVNYVCAVHSSLS